MKFSGFGAYAGLKYRVHGQGKRGVAFEGLVLQDEAARLYAKTQKPYNPKILKPESPKALKAINLKALNLRTFKPQNPLTPQKS